MIYARSRFSDHKSGVLGFGLPSGELWGVGHGPRHRKRGLEAQARRAYKRAAKRSGVTLKAHLRKAGGR